MMSSTGFHVAMLGLALLVVGCASQPDAPAPDPAPAGVRLDPSAQPTPQSVTGTVNYRQRVNLPPNAIVRVQVVDTARADGAAPIVAQTRVATNGAQVPIPFRIGLPIGALEPPAQLALQARIEVQGQLRFTSTGRYPLTQRSSERPIEIMVEPVATP
jgi:putative lipoprotein